VAAQGLEVTISPNFVDPELIDRLRAAGAVIVVSDKL
jgi:hypothetical protein